MNEFNEYSPIFTVCAVYGDVSPIVSTVEIEGNITPTLDNK